MPQDDQDEITFAADDLAIGPSVSQQTSRRSEHANRYQRESRLPKASLATYLGEDLEKALVKCAELQGPTD